MITAKEIEDLCLKYFNKYKITPNVEEALKVVNASNLTLEQTEEIFKLMKTHISFFEIELKSPLEVANLVHYTIDVLYGDEKNWNQSNRGAITKRYKELIFKKKVSGK